MQKRWIAALLFFTLLIIIAACAPKECAKNADCTKKGHTAKCVENKCQYTPIPGQCGNTRCEADVNENKCTCPDDCGKCTGFVDNPTTKTKTQYLQKTCDANKQCVQDVPATSVKPLTEDVIATSPAGRFKVTPLFNQPFNVKKDQYRVTVTLDSPSTGVTNPTISRVEVIGTTSDRRTITLGQRSVTKTYFAPGDLVITDIPLLFPTAEVESKLTGVTVQASLTYTQAGQQKTATLKAPVKTEIVYVKPTIDYGCPANCDDNNPGTKDSCGPETAYFCEHTPISGECGNSVCESPENKCTCPNDCGQCVGPAGRYVTYLCKDQQCITQTAPYAPETKTIFDDRNIGIFHLQNRFTYSNPFNVKTDQLQVELRMTEKRDDITVVRIQSARLTSGQREIGFAKINKNLNTPGAVITANVPITITPRYEEDHTPSIVIAYDYLRGDNVEQGSFTKSLERITFIGPDVSSQGQP